MSLPTYKGNKQPSKFGQKTKVYSIRLPPTTIAKIRNEEIDVAKIVHDIIEDGLNPYAGGKTVTQDNPMKDGLLKKLVSLMIEHEVEGTGFTKAEIELVQEIAAEVLS